MPFVLKQINKFEGDEAPAAQYFAGTVRIGSGKDCDLVVSSKAVLPFHCEIYHRGAEFRFVAAQSAFVELNDADVLKWPAVLSDADVLTIGDTKFQFNTIAPIARRSWKAGLASFLAVLFLSLLILFEIATMVWLPYTLHKSKAWEFATAKQALVRQVDRVRGKTRGLTTGNENEARIKILLLDTEDSIANYVRTYLTSMTREQARTVHRDLTELEFIANHWARYRKLYGMKESINPKAYIDNLCSSLEAQVKSSEKNTTIIETQNESDK